MALTAGTTDAAGREVAQPVALAYALPAERVLHLLHTDPVRGLSEQDAARRLLQYGPNALQAHAPASAFAILADQLKSPVVALLAGAAALAALFREWTEAAAILLVLLINTLIGFVTELRAARSMEALKKLGSRSSRVKREGKLITLPAEQLVPGDIVVLESGDVVTADMRLIEARNLHCDEFDPHRRIDPGGEERDPGPTRGDRRRPLLDGA